MHSLSNLKPARGAKKRRKVVGRGNSSGHGTYSTRGLKGQKSRTGGKAGLKKRAIKEQFLLKTPKFRGFKSLNKKMEIVNLEMLSHFKDGEIVTASLLAEKGLISSPDSKFKILGKGEIDKSLTVEAHAFSKKAEGEIIKKSGTIKVLK